MFSLERLRLPYREDSTFSCLSFLVFIVPLVFFILTNEGYETAKFSLFLILTGCALVAFLNRQIKGRLILAYNRPLFILLGLFLAWAVLSTVFSVDVLYSIFGFYYRFTDGLVFYFALSIFLILLVSVLDKAKLKFLLKILVFDALVISVIACLQAFNITYYAGTSTGFVQGPSLLGNPDFSAMFLAALLPFALFFWAGTDKFTPLEKNAKEADDTGKLFLIQWRSNATDGSLTGFLSKIYYGLCVFIIFTANLILASRGALLAMFAFAALALVLLLVYRFPKKFFFSLLILCVLALGFGNFFLSVSRPEAIATVVQNVDSNTTSRLAAWRISLRGVIQHPILGSGPGTFALFFERNMSSAPNIGVFDDPHNLFLRLAVTGGLPFLFLFLGLLAAAVYYGHKKLNPAPLLSKKWCGVKTEKDLLTLACLVSLIAWCVGVSFNPAPVPMFMLLAVVLAALLIGSTRDKNLAFNVWAKTVIYILAVILIIFGTDLIASEYLFGFAKTDYLNQNYQGCLKLSALAEKINPTNRLYEIYRIGAEIGLKINSGVIVNDIGKFTLIHTGQAGTYVEAGNMYNLLYAGTGNKEYLKSAIGEMNRSLDIDNFFADRYGQESLYYYELGDLSGSKTAVIKNLSLDDSNFAPWVLLGKIYQLEGNKAATVQALSRAFKLRPDIPQLEYMIYLAKNLSDIKKVPIQIAPMPAHLE